MAHQTNNQSYGANFVTTKAGLTGISGGATTFGTGSTAIQYCINGKAYSKAQVSGVAAPSTDLVTNLAYPAVPAGSSTVLVFCVNAAGVVSVAQGSVESGTFPSQFPELPDTVAAFAYVIVQNATTGTGWTYGTSNWNATGVTVTVVDVMQLPCRPQSQ